MYRFMTLVLLLMGCNHEIRGRVMYRGILHQAEAEFILVPRGTVSAPAQAVPIVEPFGARSPQWGAVRARHLEQFPTCAVCERNAMLNVHHIKPYHLYPELELEPGNLVTLCEWPSLNCHLFVGHLLSWKLYNPNVIADARRWLKSLRRARNEQSNNNPRQYAEYGEPGTAGANAVIDPGTDQRASSS